MAQPRNNPTGRTDIFLALRDSGGERRPLSTALAIQRVLEALGPFIEIRRFPLEAGDNWPIWHVRQSAIVALAPAGGERGKLRLTDGTEMWVTFAEVATRLEAVSR